MTHNRQDIILVEKAIQKSTVIDIAVPCDLNVIRTENWKVVKYQDLAFEVKRIHHVETAILSVVIRSIELLGIGDIIASTPMTALSGTAGILCMAMNL